jgi:hypothetical protein
MEGMEKRKHARFVGQSYLSAGRYGYRFVSAKDKYITREVMRDLYKVFKPIYKNYE